VSEFRDGSIGTVTYVGGGDRSLAKERVEVFGSGRAAVLDDFRKLTLAEGGRRRVWRDWVRQDKGHRGAWRAFTAAVARGGPPPISYEQVFGVALATIAAEESLRSGKPLDVHPLAAH
jgi:predicted dehydrogenase